MSEITAQATPNQYIVVFKQHTPEEVCQQHCEWAQSAHAEAAALRAESDGPELTGVGEQFNIETLIGYVGSFDENLKNEIQSREEASSTPAFSHLEGHRRTDSFDIGRLRRARLRASHLRQRDAEPRPVVGSCPSLEQP